MNKHMQAFIALIGALCLGVGVYMLVNNQSRPVAIVPVASSDPLDMSADYGIVKETVFHKGKKIAFSSPGEFFNYTGRTSWEGLKFDRMQQLPEGLHFVDGRPLGPDDYRRAMGGK